MRTVGAWLLGAIAAYAVMNGLVFVGYLALILIGGTHGN